MKFGSEIPFIKLLIPFILGIGLALRIPFSINYTAAVCAFLVVLSLILFLFKQIHLYHILGSISFLLLFAGMGSLLTSIKLNELSKSALENQSYGSFLVKTIESPIEKERSVKIEALVIGKLNHRNTLSRINEKVILYINKPLQPLKTGTFLIIRCKFKTIEDPPNPYQFNYKSYMARMGIHSTAYIGSEREFCTTRYVETGLLKSITEYSTNYLKNLVAGNMTNKEAVAVTESLLFGYKSDVSKELVNAYSRTGTLHVLAVSGMHVAIVFLIFAKSLWFIERLKNGVIIRFIIIMAGIWSYCLLTGLAPSILRAGLTISFVLLGKALHRHTNIYNLIAFSAFLILIINPIYLLDIGFQLSYAAVLGIIYLQPKVRNLWLPSTLITKEIWSIINITLCAQVATFPLSLYYFHQFPNYFLITNLVIIPLTTLIIYAGICMVIFSKVSFLLAIFSWITENLVILTNRLVQWFELLPFSYSDGIKVNSLQLLTLYIIIGGILIWMIYKQKVSLYVALISFTTYICIGSYDKISLRHQNSIVIFNIPKYNALLFSDGKKSILISDTMPEHTRMNYIRGWLIEKRLWPVNQHLSIQEIMSNKEIENKDLDFCVKNGVVFFKTFQINLSQKFNHNKTVHYTYLLPDYFDQRSKKLDYMSENVLIGHGKMKRLQKKLNFFLRKSHNNVNKIYTSSDSIYLIINL